MVKQIRDYVLEARQIRESKQLMTFLLKSWVHLLKY